MINNSEKFRFAIVGGINTLIDFGIFFALSLNGINPLFANYTSTTAALSFSFFANKRFTFKSNGRNIKKEITLFLTITLIGLWALQPIIITLALLLLAPLRIEEALLLFIVKVLATLVTLVWNYVMYSRIVFKKN